MNNLGIVQDLYDAFGKKDEARLRELLAPDVEWVQCAGFPGGGRRRGVDEVLENVFAGLRSEWRGARAACRLVRCCRKPIPVFPSRLSLRNSDKRLA